LITEVRKSDPGAESTTRGVPGTRTSPVARTTPERFRRGGAAAGFPGSAVGSATFNVKL